MNTQEQAHFDQLYGLHLRGLRDATIDSYTRAIRRVSKHFDCSPDHYTYSFHGLIITLSHAVSFTLQIRPAA
jgi:hypothetical protein